MNYFYLMSKKGVSLTFSLFCFSVVFSQTKLDENKVSQFAQEVYLNCNQYAGGQYLEFYKKEIRRIEIFKSSDLESQSNDIINNIVSLPLRSKCNPLLQYDNSESFRPENFNPLKYFFPQSTTPLYYKVGKSDFVIKVNPF